MTNQEFAKYEKLALKRVRVSATGQLDDDLTLDALVIRSDVYRDHYIILSSVTKNNFLLLESVPLPHYVFIHSTVSEDEMNECIEHAVKRKAHYLESIAENPLCQQCIALVDKLDREIITLAMTYRYCNECFTSAEKFAESNGIAVSTANRLMRNGRLCHDYMTELARMNWLE